MSGAGKVHIGPPSILSILSFFLSACRMYSSCKSSCNSSCKDVVKTASLRLTLFAYISIGICFLWWILSHTAERGWQQSLWLRISSNVFHSHWISSSFLHANIKCACVCMCARVCECACVCVCVCVCVFKERDGLYCNLPYYTSYCTLCQNAI